MRTTVLHSWLPAALAMGSQLLFAPPVRAQGSSGSLATSAQVVPSGVVVGEAPLTFGVVVPGVAKTVDATAPAAARFSGVFPPDSRLRLTLTLPVQLTSGANALPIGGWSALFSQTASTAGATAISTTKSTIVRVHPLTGAGTVFVGGTVTPSAAQPSGIYAGVITLTATFAGF